MCSIDTLKELISLSNTHNLAEIEVHHEMTRIRIKKSSSAKGIERDLEFAARGENQGLGAFFSQHHEQGMLTDSTIQSDLWHEQLPSSAEEFPTMKHTEITSPMVGTFYKALSPGSKPRIEIGDEVNPETVVGVIETMKIINDIKAGIVGKVVETLVEDGEPVEYGQPLFLVQAI